MTQSYKMSDLKEINRDEIRGNFDVYVEGILIKVTSSFEKIR